jgi:hypothetical protein
MEIRKEMIIGQDSTTEIVTYISRATTSLMAECTPCDYT